MYTSALRTEEFPQSPSLSDLGTGAAPALEVRDAYRDFLIEKFIRKGVAGFKLDEVDGSPNTGRSRYRRSGCRRIATATIDHLALTDRGVSLFIIAY